VLHVLPEKDGPLKLKGPLEICSGTGRTINRVLSAKLCRCGGSANKPYCDGSHRSNGFKSD
jgi:CDGSH-type Zn-finger protein